MSMSGFFSLHTLPIQPYVAQAMRKSAAALALFKDEFRAAQRLRSTEGIYIPEVGP
jgi:hypothetical protein